MHYDEHWHRSLPWWNQRWFQERRGSAGRRRACRWNTRSSQRYDGHRGDDDTNYHEQHWPTRIAAGKVQTYEGLQDLELGDLAEESQGRATDVFVGMLQIVQNSVADENHLGLQFAVGTGLDGTLPVPGKSRETATRTYNWRSLVSSWSSTVTQSRMTDMRISLMSFPLAMCIRAALMPSLFLATSLDSKQARMDCTSIEIRLLSDEITNVQGKLRLAIFVEYSKKTK